MRLIAAGLEKGVPPPDGDIPPVRLPDDCRKDKDSDEDNDKNKDNDRD